MERASGPITNTASLSPAATIFFNFSATSCGVGTVGVWRWAFVLKMREDPYAERMSSVVVSRAPLSHPSPAAILAATANSESHY